MLQHSSTQLTRSRAADYNLLIEHVLDRNIIRRGLHMLIEYNIMFAQCMKRVQR